MRVNPLRVTAAFFVLVVSSQAVRADPDGAAQFGTVVDGDGDEVVGADGLGGEIGADFRCGDRAIR